MQILLIVNNPANWPLDVRGVDVVAARQYLTDPAYNSIRNARVFNLCRSFSYQSLGYYVSLLAEARGHRPQPDIVTLQDMRWSKISRVMTDEFDDLIQKTLRTITGEQFTLSIYFGRTIAKRDRRLGQRLFSVFPAPLLRAQFTRKGKGKWQLQSIRPIPAREVSPSHREAAVEAASEMFARRQWTGPRPRSTRYDMAVLVDPEEMHPPSTERTLNRFMRSAARREIASSLITREDFAQLVEYDALFIRTTTAVNHYTYRFARRAEAEGLAVIDDPTSIARCTNKVYLAERMTLGKVRIPRTVIVHRDNMDSVLKELGLPVVLKQPDSSFSAGVTKAHDEDEYHRMAGELLSRSEMIVAQEFLPTDYDWRVGVLDGEPLYACKYFMAPRHWQILNHDGGRVTEGEAETLAIHDAPRNVIRTAVKAARLIGDGLYGVDLKQVGRHVYVIEVNDNPNIDTGYEDKVLKDELYERLADSFIRRIERIREGTARRGR